MTTSDENKGCLKMRVIEYHDIKTLLGPCFVSFSLPLLVPGVVLTVVGSYGNENSFPTFGAWHISGIVILGIAIVMLISGIILKCCYRPIISADIEEHLSPRSSVISGHKNLGCLDDNEDIYRSKRAQNSNKVGHHDIDSSHTVVSTHEARNSSSVDHNSQFLANLAVAESEKGPKQKPVPTSVTAQRTSGANPPQSSGAHSSNNRKPPPSYEQINPDSHKNDPTSDVVEITRNNVTTRVTASISAEVETLQASGTRDHSSDGNETSKFLPEVKKKKKKKRKRQDSTRNHDVTDGDVSSKRELPELSMRPALVHEGDQHHHHDLHVHFQTVPDVNQQPKDISHELSNTGDI